MGSGIRDGGCVRPDLDVGATPALANEVASLVRSHRDEPGLESLRLAQGTELLPGDRPGGLDGVVGKGLVAA